MLLVLLRMNRSQVRNLLLMLSQNLELLRCYITKVLSRAPCPYLALTHNRILTNHRTSSYDALNDSTVPDDRSHRHKGIRTQTASSQRRIGTDENVIRQSGSVDLTIILDNRVATHSDLWYISPQCSAVPYGCTFMKYLWYLSSNSTAPTRTEFGAIKVAF